MISSTNISKVLISPYPAVLYRRTAESPAHPRPSGCLATQIAAGELPGRPARPRTQTSPELANDQNNMRPSTDPSTGVILALHHNPDAPTLTRFRVHFFLTTLRMQLQPVFRCSSLSTLDPGSGREIPAIRHGTGVWHGNFTPES